MLQTEIAVLRFGLGARPGDLNAATPDPRGWLRQQIRGALPLAVATPLTPSDQIFAAVLAARQERQEQKREAVDTGAGGSGAALAANNILRVGVPAALPRSGSGAGAKRRADDSALR
jgi:uncharacterized protein (DUF1800 family)